MAADDIWAWLPTDPPPCAALGPNIMVPEKGKLGDVQRAKQVCKSCDPTTRTACADYATDNNELGVWGGLTAEERKRRKSRARKANGTSRATHVGDIVHGGTGGYHAHRRAGELPCDLCREAYNAQRSSRRRVS